MVLSRPALELLATPSFLDECRHRLYACAPLAPHSGCRFKTNNKPEQPYTSKQLVGLPHRAHPAPPGTTTTAPAHRPPPTPPTCPPLPPPPQTSRWTSACNPCSPKDGASTKASVAAAHTGLDSSWACRGARRPRDTGSCQIRGARAAHRAGRSSPSTTWQTSGHHHQRRWSRVVTPCRHAG